MSNEKKPVLTKKQLQHMICGAIALDQGIFTTIDIDKLKQAAALAEDIIRTMERYNMIHPDAKE